MREITIKTSDLQNQTVFDDVDVMSCASDLCKYYSIPQTLLNVDSKFGTSTFKDVLQAATEKISFVVSDQGYHALDPKSIFVNDKTFDAIKSSIAKTTFVQEVSRGLETKFIFDVTTDEEKYGEDIYRKRVSITRLPQGGLYTSTELLRLACTNGSMVADAKSSKLLRTLGNAEQTIKSITDQATEFDVETYLKSIFEVKGKPLMCSFGDMSEMSRFLTSFDLGDTPYPLDDIIRVYLEQGIEVEKLSQKNQCKLPTGFSYYEAVNVLTHAAKTLVPSTTENNVRLASYFSPRRMRGLQDSSVVFQQSPEFSHEFKHKLMGDIN